MNKEEEQKLWDAIVLSTREHAKMFDEPEPIILSELYHNYLIFSEQAHLNMIFWKNFDVICIIVDERNKIEVTVSGLR